MRVVKLNRRYALGKVGFTHALRFPRDNAQAAQIRKIMYDMHGDGWNRWYNSKERAWGYYRSPERSRPTYWIGVKNEADLTAAILMTEIDNV